MSPKEHLEVYTLLPPPPPIPERLTCSLPRSPKVLRVPSPELGLESLELQSQNLKLIYQGSALTSAR